MIFRIRIVDGDSRKTVFTRKVDPHLDRGDRRWFEVDLPLDAWSGRAISLELVTECSSPRGEVLEMGGWEIPRLVIDAATERRLE